MPRHNDCPKIVDKKPLIKRFGKLRSACATNMGFNCIPSATFFLATMKVQLTSKLDRDLILDRSIVVKLTGHDKVPEDPHEAQMQRLLLGARSGLGGPVEIWWALCHHSFSSYMPCLKELAVYRECNYVLSGVIALTVHR